MTTSARVMALCARGVAIGLLAIVVSACSRTVTWEEEVPLNTGETIWIERTMPWAMEGGFGNPFDFALRPAREQTIRFAYRGTEYRYVGRANVRWIAIAPTKTPLLVFKAGDFAWDVQNQFLCVVPHYVQLIPDGAGKHWTWPNRIDSWLYHMPANVMASIPSLDEKQRKYTAKDKLDRDAVYRLQVPEAVTIDPSYKGNGCLHELDVGPRKGQDRSTK